MNQEKCPEFKSWKNQYIDLVETSERIISIYSTIVPEDKKNLLRLCLKDFATCVIEIGSGSGGHLVERAALEPKVLFIGFETRFKRAFKTIEKAKRKGLNNLLMLRADAKLLPQLFEANSVSGIYVNFPDPWAKRRWRKNRILNPEFLKIISSALKPNGFFSYKTDHQEYFVETETQVRQMPEFSVDQFSQDLYASSDLSANVASEFELLFKSQNISICYLFARKIGAISN